MRDEDSQIMQTMERARCPVCDSIGEPLHKALTDRLFGTAGLWNMSRCVNEDCQLTWLNPLPTETAIAQAYVDYYTHAPDSTDSTSTGTTVMRFLQKWYAKLLGYGGERPGLEDFFLDAENPGSVLEVGSGSGERLRRLAAMGWTAEGQEVDPASLGIAQSSGLNIHFGSIHDDYFSDRSFDRVVSNHVLEHVHDPAAFLKRCRQLLNDSGKIVFTTPNIRSFGHRLFGRNWLHLDPPRHLQIFSPNALHQLLLDCGYREVSITTSAARADLSITGSIDIAVHGRHALSHARPSVLNAAVTVGLWTAARIYGFFVKDSGEELVAIAGK